MSFFSMLKHTIMVEGKDYYISKGQSSVIPPTIVEF